MTDSAISVVIPTYNGSAFVSETLRSVFAQTLLPKEIIVVDDCSTDNTVAVVEQLRGESPVPLHIERLARNSGGPAKPLNTGLAKARSPLVAILEQDDRMRPTRLESQRTALAQDRNCKICIGKISVIGHPEGSTASLWGNDDQFMILDEFGDTSGSIPSPIAVRALLRRNFAATNSTILVDRDYALRIGGFSSSIKTCVDLDFLLRAAESADVAVVPQIITDYSWRGESLYRSRKRLSTFECALVRYRHCNKSLLVSPEEKWSARTRLQAAAWQLISARNLATPLSVVLLTYCEHAISCFSRNWIDAGLTRPSRFSQR